MDDETVWAAPVDEPRDDTVSPALVTGAAATFVALFACYPLFVNTLGPFDDHQGLGVLATVVAGLVVGVLVFLGARAAVRRSRVRFAVLVVALAAAAVVLFPTRIDRHESFAERPNERSSCTGLTFRNYPPGMADGSSTVYCVGLERPAPPG